MSQKFDGYTIVRDLTKARDIMLNCLLDYFHGKTRYKQSKTYLKYQKWIQKHIDPSYQNVYNFIKHNTDLVDVDKKILFTLTDGAVFYRFQTDYFNYINNKFNTKTPTKTQKKEPESTQPKDPEKATPTTPWERPSIPTHVDIAKAATDADSLATPDPTINDEKPSPQLQDIVQNIETQLDEEVASIQYDFTAAPTFTPQNIRQMEKEIETLQTRINSLTGKENALTKNVRDMEQKLHELQQNTTETLTLQQNEYATTTNKLQAKVTFITKQLELAETKVRNVESMIERIVESKVQKSVDKINQRLHHIVETAEQDVTATMISFEHHVKKNKQKTTATQVVPATQPSSSHTIASENTANTQDMKLLFRKYREKLRIIDQRMETWDLVKADRDLDTLLVAKLNDFDSSTEKTFRELEKSKQKIIKLSKRIRRKLKTKQQRHVPNYLLPRRHAQQPPSDDDSISSFDTSDDSLHEATIGKNNEKIFSNSDTGSQVRQNLAHTTVPVSNARTNRAHTTRPYPQNQKYQYSQTDRTDTRKNNQYQTSPYTDTRVNTEYLRKNIKISCADDSHLLEFYRKLRLCVQKGGIFLAQLEDLDPDRPIYDTNKFFNIEEVQNQSNALYTLLTNEEIITNDYTQAQNCLSARNDTMDGFGALKNMLTTVHPNFTKKTPPHNPPTLSATENLHSYEQQLRNYFLLHYLYSGYMPTEIQKSEQYLRGLDDETYSQAKTRIVTQIDSVNVYGTTLPEKFLLENITGTVLNLSEHQPTINTLTVNALNRQRTNQPFNNTRTNSNNNAKYNPGIKPNTPRQGRKPLENIQCHACKTFGHRTSNCNMVGKVLAIMDLKQRNESICKTILQSHVEKNSPQKRLAIIKTLQSTDMLPNDTPAETYILDSDIQDSITHTINATNCLIPDGDLFSTYTTSSQE